MLIRRSKLVGAVHVSFSDFPLLPVVRKNSAEVLMNLISKLSLAFLDEKIEDALRDVRTRKMEFEVIGKKEDGEPKTRCIGEVGDVIVH
jgi:platelet-activating factor acetylhydrolase